MRSSVRHRVEWGSERRCGLFILRPRALTRRVVARQSERDRGRNASPNSPRHRLGIPNEHRGSDYATRAVVFGSIGLLGPLSATMHNCKSKWAISRGFRVILADSPRRALRLTESRV